MLGGPGGVDPSELVTLMAELEGSGYHLYLRTYVEARIAQLNVDDVTTADVAMKRRGQTEELARLIAPLFVKTLALAALARRAEARATAAGARPPMLPGFERAWWLDPEVGDEFPIP
jgi:hypothetical protein